MATRSLYRRLDVQARVLQGFYGFFKRAFLFKNVIKRLHFSVSYQK